MSIREKLSFEKKYAPELFIGRFYYTDDYSRTVYDSAVRFYSDYGNAEANNYISELPEIRHKYVFVHEGDYVIDGGVSGDVDQTEYFLLKTGPNGKVFGIEPNPYVKDIILGKLKNYNNFVLFQCALWDSNGSGKLNLGVVPLDDINYNAHIVSEKVYNINENVVEVKFIKLDDLIKENNIEKLDYVKFDLEGAELPALSASVKTLKKFQPDVVLNCHKDYDFFMLPALLHKINPKYKIYLVQHEGSANYWRNYIIYATVRNADEHLINNDKL